MSCLFLFTLRDNFPSFSETSAIFPHPIPLVKGQVEVWEQIRVGVRGVV